MRVVVIIGGLLVAALVAWGFFTGRLSGGIGAVTRGVRGKFGAATADTKAADKPAAKAKAKPATTEHIETKRTEHVTTNTADVAGEIAAYAFGGPIAVVASLIGRGKL